MEVRPQAVHPPVAAGCRRRRDGASSIASRTDGQQRPHGIGPVPTLGRGAHHRVERPQPRRRFVQFDHVAERGRACRRSRTRARSPCGRSWPARVPGASRSSTAASTFVHEERQVVQAGPSRGNMSRTGLGPSPWSSTNSTITAPHWPYAELWSKVPGRPRTTTSTSAMCSRTKNGPAPKRAAHDRAADFTSGTAYAICTGGPSAHDRRRPQVPIPSDLARAPLSWKSAS